jgi:L-ascorbate metabolism protein UlaG (beta-lactamase superfamily)
VPPPSARAPVVPTRANDGAALRTAARPTLTWIGHASYLVQLGGRSILTDPVLSPRIVTLARHVPPGLDWSALPRVTAVTVSHNHMDHMDAPTLRRLGPDVTYLVPSGLAGWFRRAGLTRVVELAWWDAAEVDGVRFTFVPAHHWSRRGLFDTNASLWGGFVMEADGLRVYHAGDTALFDGFAEIGARVGPIDAALLPIGAYEPRWFMQSQHMNPQDAVAAFTALGARRFVAMHWGTFKLTDEALDEPPRVLRAEWAARNLPDARLAVPAIGETLWLDG